MLHAFSSLLGVPKGVKKILAFPQTFRFNRGSSIKLLSTKPEKMFPLSTGIKGVRNKDISNIFRNFVLFRFYAILLCFAFVSLYAGNQTVEG